MFIAGDIDLHQTHFADIDIVYFTDTIERLMITSWHSDTFRIGGPLWGESNDDSPQKESVMWSFDIFFVVSLNKLWKKQLSYW